MRCLFKEEDYNGLIRQLGKPRIVYDTFFFFGEGAGVVYRGGQEWYIEGGNSERCLKWGGGESLRNLF